jgi:hypothetical protein
MAMCWPLSRLGGWRIPSRMAYSPGLCQESKGRGVFPWGLGSGSNGGGPVLVNHPGEDTWGGE